MKNKIIFFHPYFGNGGVERTNIRLSRYFIEKGYIVEFLSLFFKGEIVEEAKKCGIKLVALEKRRTVSAVWSIRNYVRRQKKEAYITIISCQNYANIIMWFALIGLRKRLKLIFSERSHPVSLLTYASGLKTKLIIWLMKRTYCYADKIVANSQEMAEDLGRLVHVPVECIYNPTYSEAFSEMADEVIKEPWFEQNIPIIITVGRLEKEKDFATLIRAFAKVRACKECRLVLVGSGSQQGALNEIVRKLNIEDDVRFLEFDPNPYKYMVKASVFVLSSIYEGLPNALIEATALKIPCVATNCKSGAKEILLYGEGGKLVDVGDVDAMADAILWVLNNEGEAKQLTEKAFACLNRFTLEAAGEGYLKIIEE